MSTRVLVIYSGKLGVGGANVFLQDLLDSISKITGAQFYLVSIWTQRGLLCLELSKRDVEGYKCLIKVCETFCAGDLDRILERVSRFISALVRVLKPNSVVVNSVDPAILNIAGKVISEFPDLYIVVHDGGFFCPLKHMWDPIGGKPCSMPCLVLREVPDYCIAAAFLLKLGYVQPLFNPLKRSFLKCVKSINGIRKETLCKLWEISRRVLEESTVITPSKFMAFLVKHFADTDIITIRHGAPSELFALARKPKRNSRISVGFVGDVSLHKGIHVFLEAINNLVNKLNRMIFQTVSFYIVGSIHTLSKTSVGIINKYKHLLGKYVYVLGSIRSRVKIYSLLDVVVLPSICHENAPLTVVEGIASGRYVVASNVGGVPEYLSDYPQGYLVKPGDAYQLAEVLDKVISKISSEPSHSSSKLGHRGYVDSITNVAKVYARVLIGI